MLSWLNEFLCHENMINDSWNIFGSTLLKVYWKPCGLRFFSPSRSKIRWIKSFREQRFFPHHFIPRIKYNLFTLSMFHAPSYHYVSFTQLCIINSCTYWGPIMCLNKKTHTWRDNWNNTMSKMAEKLEAILGSRGMRYLIHPGERYQGSLLKGETPEIHFKGWWRRGRGSIS